MALFSTRPENFALYFTQDKPFGIEPKAGEVEIDGSSVSLSAEPGEQALADIAQKIDLGAYMAMDHGSEMSGVRTQSGPLSDAMEAVLAAVYLDGGFERAREVVSRLWPDQLEATEDAKSRLQEDVARGAESHLHSTEPYPGIIYAARIVKPESEPDPPSRHPLRRSLLIGIRMMMRFLSFWYLSGHL